MINKFYRQVGKIHRDQRGQGMAEYGLIIALVAVIAIVGFQLLGREVNEKVNRVGETIRDSN